MEPDRPKAATRRRALNACLAAGVAALIAVVTTATGAVSEPLMLKANPAPTTVAQCKRQFAHNAKARSACIKRVKKHHRSGSGGQCNLKTERQPQGEVGDGKDFSVRIVVLSPPKVEGGSATIAVQVTVHNPHVVICSATIIVSVVPNPSGPAKNLEYHVKIGPHGGRSSSITTPDRVVFEIAEVRGRRG